MNKYNTWMSIERNQRSPSFRSRQRTAKVNQHSKLLPNDFFPKTLSQSPKKRNDPPTSAEVLAEWYQREQSADKPKKEFHRLAYNRPSMSRVSLCQDKEQTQIEKQRYVMDYYHKMKDHIKTKAQPGNPPCIFSLKKIEENTQKNIIPLQQKKDQPKVRLIRSQSRPKRNNQTPQSCSKRILITRRSVQKLNKIKQGPVAMAFDGTVTFSRFK